MSTHKQDLLEVVAMARESLGSHMPDEASELDLWLDRVKRQIESGSVHDRLRRQVSGFRAAIGLVRATAASLKTSLGIIRASILTIETTLDALDEKLSESDARQVAINEGDGASENPTSENEDEPPESDPRAEYEAIEHAGERDPRSS